MSVDTEVSVSGGELFREQYMYKHPPVSQMKTDLKFSDEDKAVLRRLAEKVAAIAERENMKFKKKTLDRESRSEEQLSGDLRGSGERLERDPDGRCV